MRQMIIALLLVSPTLVAEQTLQVMDAQIEDSGQRFNGNFSLNQAAGLSHQQVNSRVISTGDSANATSTIRQTLEIVPGSTTGAQMNSRIEGASFSQGNGVIGINQSAGIGNQHINAFRITLGAVPESLDDSVLSQNVTRPSISGIAVPKNGERSVAISDDAFAGSRGVVQLNQSAGIGNTTANNLSIRVVE
ncbi:adhesin [Pseudomonas sp.]|uniref:adhesin n=1 Tax=Pseudomonas sp. TaxID=306 RepID=UPI002730FF9E|nr:adhesin [Pseudomonas sp.]MDP2245443.1 adhesin [Pseudomonas sp.]